MKLTKVLRAQHLGWYFKKHWQIQGKRTPVDTGAKSVLEELNKNVVDANDIADEKLSKVRITSNVNSMTQISNEEKCFVYEDKHVLLEGLVQAKILTNTIEIASMPKRITEFVEGSTIPSIVDENIHDAILSSFVYYSEQEKTAKIKIPERPAFNLPRNYGITDYRKSQLIVSKLLLECEKLSGRPITEKRRMVDDINFITSFNKGDSKIQINLPIQVFIASYRPIEPSKEKYNADLADIFPLRCTISIPRERELALQNFYPLQELRCSHPHTVITYYSPETVRNLNETAVTTTQFQARTLLAAFTTAMARAQQLYGNTKTIPKPIVVQSIQTDGRTFHFGVYQLNTMDFDNTDGSKNYWFHLSNSNLFEDCEYIKGRPVLQGYNKEVIKYVRAFYQNN